MGKKLKLSFKITVMAISMVLVCSVCISVFMYGEIRKDLYRLKGVSAQTAASSLASAFDAIEIQTLHITETENSYYYYLKRAMRTVGEHIDFKFLFILTKAGNGTDYKVIYAQNGVGDYTLELGCLEPIHMMNETTEYVFETGEDAYSEPYLSDDSGYMITGYSPIFNAYGRVVAVVGMELSADDVKTDLARIRRITILFVSAFVFFFSLISVIYTKRGIGDPITALSKMSDNVLEGNLDYDANIKSNDEIGLLYDNFKKMQDTIRDLVDSVYKTSHEHKNGDLDVKIDADKFNGAFKDVAVSFNDFLIDINTDVLETLDAFKKVSDGDFDIELSPRPGQKNYSNKVFDSVKKSLRTVYLGISVLVKNTADGELIEGEEVSQYSGDWGPLMRKIVRYHLEAEKQRQIIVDGLNYAGKIQKSLLPAETGFKQAFEDYSVIWKPRDIVGGDIYWLKNFDGGTVLCACDCTGHGTPGALLTMLVVSALEAAVTEGNYKDTADIIWQLEKRLVTVFSVNMSAHESGKAANVQDGCDLAVLFISKDKSVTISSGHINVFVCDGREVKRFKGQKIFVGEGKLNGKDDVRTIKIQANPDNKFYIASDGLFDQIGGKPPRPFGYRRFTDVILENHGEKQSVISEKVWEAFENYQGEQSRRDDFELITFKP